MIGTSVSAFFLLAIAIANIVVLVAFYRTFRAVRAAAAMSRKTSTPCSPKRGLMGRLFRRFFR